MDIEYGSKEARKFITNVGLLTSNGPIGHNIMACEWTHHVSYSPGRIAVCIGADSATLTNIRKSKEFGVSLCSVKQSVLSSVAGGSTGSEVDKISALKELGFKFYKAKKINAFMVEGASLNVECKLFKEIETGSHIMLIGEAVEVSMTNEESITYHDGKYWKLGEKIAKPEAKRLDEIKKIVTKNKR